MPGKVTVDVGSAESVLSLTPNKESADSFIDLIELEEWEDFEPSQPENEQKNSGDFEDDDSLEPENPPLTYEELRARLPPYALKTPAQKRRFFARLTRKYFEKMQPIKRKIALIRRTGLRVTFNLNSVEIKRFSKCEALL